MYSLIKLGIEHFKSKKQKRVLFLGLDGSGKTTIFNQLKRNYNIDIDLNNITPTLGFNLTKLTFNNENYTLLDVSGNKKLRKLWQNHFDNLYRMIYVIDINDLERKNESIQELDNIVSRKKSLLHEGGIVVIFNKTDLIDTSVKRAILDDMVYRILLVNQKDLNIIQNIYALSAKKASSFKMIDILKKKSVFFTEL